MTNLYQELHKAMIISVTPSTSSLLRLFLEREPRDLYSIASKANLQEGIEFCRHTSIDATAWNADKSSISITFSSIATTTLTSNGMRILTGCSCRLWRPGLQCPHVVTAWALFKRLVSPGSLFQIKFSDELLERLSLFSGIERLPGTSRPGMANRTPLTKNEAILRKVEELVDRQKKPVELIASKSYRLLIAQDRYNSIKIGIYCGKEEIQRWSSQRAPVAIQRFLMTHFYAEPSQRYLDSFLTMTNGNYPIIFRSKDNKETELVWTPDRPLTATLTFDLRGDEVHLIKTVNNGELLSEQTITTSGLLLINQKDAVIQPLRDAAAWKAFDQLEEQIYAADEKLNPDDFDGDDDDDAFYEPDDDQELTSSEIRSINHGIAVTCAHFNKAALRLLPEMVSQDDSVLFFKKNGKNIQLPDPSPAEYLLNIERLDANLPVQLTPLGRFNSQLFFFSNSTFWFLSAQKRAHLPVPLKAKKRINYLAEIAFKLLDETKTTVRAKLITSALTTPDFIKRTIKRDAKQLLNRFSTNCGQKLLVLNAQPDGWQIIEDDPAAQAKLVRIIFELFGADCFAQGELPGAAELPAELLMQHLPALTKKLEGSGFSLLVDLQPLATGSWQFSLDATHSSLDWFELKPEIRVNGELLTDQELQELLGGSGMLRKDGKLLLLDELSSQILAMFSGAMAGKKSKKGKQELVRVPRLQILDWLQLRKHGVDVQLAPQDAEILESLLNFEQLPKPALPEGLIADLRHYQLDAWHWLSFLYQHRFGACLADDMGLGKTLQGITLMAGIMSGAISSAAPEGSPHLVVAPPSLLFNWEAEIARFLPAAKVLLYAGTGRSTEQFTNHDIIITSYGIIQRDHEKLEELRFDVIIFDETQVVKNLQASTTNAVRKLKGAFILALTGTPVENHLGEYYAIMDLCLPGLLGSHDEFNRQISKGGPPATQRLIQRTKPFVLRRTKQMIAAELPPKIETDIQLELSPKQKVLYQRTVEEVKGQVLDAYQNHAVAQARIIALTAILRLRQICLAPILAAATASDSSPKLEFLAEQLLELRDEGHSVLVFSQFTGYLDIIEKGLKQQGLACLRLDGSTPVPQRKHLVQSFQNSAVPLVFLISLKAGGKGLNLTRATYVYHMDPWWNPAVENQASDRAHRIGQTEQVTITRLIMRHTIEEKMMALKARKLELYKALLEDGTGGGGSGLTREDFEFLLG
jgi:superfamily II DNA or RNA helicase